MKLHDCPACNNGKVTAQVSTYGQPAKTKTMVVDCVWCDGTGMMHDEILKQYNYHQNMWCTCENVGGNVKYYDNGEHPEINKHHYRHIVCGKVVQIG